MFRNIWGGFVRGIWESLKMLDIDTPECCNLSLEGSSFGSMEDHKRQRNTNWEYYMHLISEWAEDAIRIWTEADLCYIATKNMSIFSSCPKVGGKLF